MKNREKKLIEIIDALLWMAARYAHGRRTYAPTIIRECVSEMRVMYPDWTVETDKVIEPPNMPLLGLRQDYLDDIFNPNPDEEKNRN